MGFLNATGAGRRVGFWPGLRLESRETVVAEVGRMAEARLGLTRDVDGSEKQKG